MPNASRYQRVPSILLQLCKYLFQENEEIFYSVLCFTPSDELENRYAFHEIPTDARYRILRECRRLLKPGGMLAVVDINPNEYVPSDTMLSGEPYVLEYQQKIQEQLEKIPGFNNREEVNVVPGHVTMWTMERE